jgi:hypothetical protein
LDNLEVSENLCDFFAAVADFREDLLGKCPVNQTAGLEKFNDLLVVHGTGKRKVF